MTKVNVKVSKQIEGSSNDKIRKIGEMLDQKGYVVDSIELKEHTYSMKLRHGNSLSTSDIAQDFAELGFVTHKIELMRTK